jgi:hypothetical protein
MAFLTTNPSPFIINQPELTNVITSASGIGTLSNSVSEILSFVNTANASLSVNSIGSSTSGSITFTNNIVLSNATLTTNNLNGAGFVAVSVNQAEKLRATPTGVGILTTAPLAALDVNGSEIVRGSLYISSMGAAVTSTLGYVYADGDIYARSINYPSDPRLKHDIKPYAYKGMLPQPMEFKWNDSGLSDIGVLADEMETIEPSCVSYNTRSGVRTVNYPKLVLLCLAELHVLRSTVSGLQAH